VEKLKRLRFFRSVVSVLAPLMAVPLWLLPINPASGQAAPPPPPATTAPPPTTTAPPPTTTTPPPAIPVPPVPAAGAAGQAMTNSAGALNGGSLLVWTMDARSVAPSNAETLGIMAAQDIVTAFVGNSRWKAGLLKPDPQQNSPLVQRAIDEEAQNAGTHDLQDIVDSSNQPSPMQAEQVANTLGYDAVLLGTIDQLAYNRAKNSASAQMSLQVYDARDPATAREIGGAVTVSGTSGAHSGALSADTLEGMALQQAAQRFVVQFSPVGSRASMTSSTRAHHGFSLGHILPILAGAAAIAIIVAVASNHGSSSSTPATSTFAPPQNAVAVQEPIGGAVGIDLRFSASTAGSAVENYLVVRHGPNGATPIDTILAQSGGPVYTTTDTQANGALPGATYSYTVQAMGFNGQLSVPVPFVAANGQTTITVGQPAPPTNLAAQLAGKTVVLTWTPTVDAQFITGYQVVRSTRIDGGYVPISPVITNTTFQDVSPGLVSGQVYYYSVQAISQTTPQVLSALASPVAVKIP